MFSKKTFVFILSLLMLASCDEDPLQIKVGSIKLQLNELDNQPSQINVTLQPEDRELTFDNSSQLLIEGLDVGQYSVIVNTLNDRGIETYHGSADEIVVEGNKETFVSIDMESLVPPTPTGLTTSRTGVSDITLFWNPTVLASAYKLYRSISFSGGYQLVKNSSSTLWRDASVQMAKWYYYKVSAYSDAGESPSSKSVGGYRKGWRFDDVSIYDPTDGIGLYYDLRAYGFKDVPKTVAIYAAYKDSSKYYFIPGCGELGLVAHTFERTPTYDEALWDDSWISFYDSCWDSNYRNNRYEQFIQMRIYRSSNASILSADIYDETRFYKIVWTSNNAAKRLHPIIVSTLSDNASATMSRMVMRNPSINYSEKSTSHHFGSNKEKRVVRALFPMILNEGLQKVSH